VLPQPVAVESPIAAIGGVHRLASWDDPLDRLTLAIWVETPRAQRPARGTARDGEAMP
jgi:hypothetical protein